MSGRIRVVGLDLSLASAGMSDGHTTRVVQTSPEEVLEARMDRVVRGAVSLCLGTADWPKDADLVVIEDGAPSRGAQSQAAEILSSLRLMVRHRLWRLSIPFAMVRPTTLKLVTTGNGRASKPEMVNFVEQRHQAGLERVLIKDGRYDMADALALAAMGYEHVGKPLPYHFPAPPLNKTAIEKVNWPGLLSDDW